VSDKVKRTTASLKDWKFDAVTRCGGGVELFLGEGAKGDVEPQ
jgi:hypothetical protein